MVKRVSIVIGALIIIGIIASVVITNVLNDRIAAAQETGSEEGYAQGYVIGYQEGTTVGYQEGSNAGYQEGSGAGYEKGKEEGYGSGHKAGFEQAIGAGYSTRNPTYNEVQQILAQEKTTSAWEINNHAEAQGIRTAYVWVIIATQEMGWELVAFDTLDQGLVFFEPWSDKEASVEIGKRYSALNRYLQPGYDDTITKITIIW